MVFSTASCLYGQFDSIEIVRTLSDPPYSVAEGFFWKNTGTFYYFINMQGDSISRFSLNRYKKFKAFFEEHTSLSYLKEMMAEFEEEDGRPAAAFYSSFYDYDIFCYKKGKSYHYSFNEALKSFKEFELIKELYRFRKDFYQEHLCDNFWTEYIVEEGETLESIGKKYNIGAPLLVIMNYGSDYRYYDLKNRDFSLHNVLDAKEELKVGDRIYVPCNIQKVSKYE
ncbi:LysM domain-containing protein [Saprospira sp. CCB-QB6]|uniref:LysM peptidoglycan-binding domain-containing protein n=1 Tax=Saprospira sp. CCB-QB6 TaxID=3023936 RepID=UPI00234AA70B|nr:LysM domain-containing protein [Saprospira sp. CCB-QB6]WCL81256.1 LysM domain-containing protein [Saprospira sp. CCB-QB6]